MAVFSDHSPQLRRIELKVDILTQHVEVLLRKSPMVSPGLEAAVREAAKRARAIDKQVPDKNK